MAWLCFLLIFYINVIIPDCGYVCLIIVTHPILGEPFARRLRRFALVFKDPSAFWGAPRCALGDKNKIALLPYLPLSGRPFIKAPRTTRRVAIAFPLESRYFVFTMR
jgi:hypothetical protein